MIKLLFFIAVAAGFVFVARIMRLIGTRKRTLRPYIPVFNLVEFTAWTALVFAVIKMFFSNSVYYSYLVLFIEIAYASLFIWYYLKDIVAGFLFRIRHNPIKGQLITNDTLHGTIKGIGTSQLIVESTSGTLTRVPYSGLVTKPLSLQIQYRNVPGETVLKFKLNTLKDHGTLERSVRKALALSSWCIASKPITITTDPADHQSIDILFYMIDPVYVPLAKETLTRVLVDFH